MTNKIRLFVFTVLAICLLNNFCSAQTTSDATLIKQFEQSFAIYIYHPPKLYAKCIPVMCMLKISIDNNGKINDTILSDSADSTFSVIYEKNKSHLEYNLIEEYCSKLSIKNKILLIPLHYSFKKSFCPNPQIDFNSLAKYSMFRGVYLKEDVILLEPVAVQSVLHDY